LSLLRIRKSVEEVNHTLLEVPSAGFGYPLDGFGPKDPWPPFQKPTLLGFALQSFVPSSGSGWSFLQHLFRSCALAQNLSALSRRLSGLRPRRKRCSSQLPDELDRVGASCSHGLSDLSGSPNFRPPKGHLSLSVPLSFFLPPLLTKRSSRNLRGLRSRSAGFFFPHGKTPTRLAFFPTASPIFSAPESPAGYFFTFRDQSLLRRISRRS
jgi:hypothetical protein